MRISNSFKQKSWGRWMKMLALLRAYNELHGTMVQVCKPANLSLACKIPCKHRLKENTSLMVNDAKDFLTLWQWVSDTAIW
jgi:hypothetical protein